MLSQRKYCYPSTQQMLMTVLHFELFSSWSAVSLHVRAFSLIYFGLHNVAFGVLAALLTSVLHRLF